jgi:hypothetical protein
MAQTRVVFCVSGHYPWIYKNFIRFFKCLTFNSRHILFVKFIKKHCNTIMAVECKSLYVITYKCKSLHFITYKCT